VGVFIAEFGIDAYSKARSLERDPSNQDLPSRWARVAVSACGLLVLGFSIFIYMKYPFAYLKLMNLMIKFRAPHPFVDWEYVPSAIRCWAEGVNVYIDNTCYNVGGHPQPFPYSPLLLRATFLAADEHWIYVTMISVCVLFFLSLATLTPPHDWRELIIALFATLSSASFLAAERGNADLILFLIIVAGIHLRVLPLAFRLGGYGLIILAGLVKFYPFVALIVVLRERLFVVAAVAVTSLAALATLLFYHHELALMAANLPAPSYFTMQFGSANLSSGIGLSVGKIMEKLGCANADAAQAIGALVSRAVLPILVVSAITVAFLIARRCDLRLIEAGLPTRQLDFLVAGAALISGCFFASQSVIYRGIYLLLALPGLAELSRQITTPLGRRLFGSAGAAIVFVLWRPFLSECLNLAGLSARLDYIGLAPRAALLLHYPNNYNNFPSSTFGYGLWLASELAWWWIVTLLLAVLVAFLGRTELWKRLFWRFRLGGSDCAESRLEGPHGGPEAVAGMVEGPEFK
jgi:hypothetical protein